MFRKCIIPILMFLIAAPDRPTIVNVFVNSSDTMTLSWSVGSTRTIDSTVIQSNDTIANNQSTINVTDPQTTRQQTISNLVPGKQYCFNVTVTSFGKTVTSSSVCNNTREFEFRVEAPMCNAFRENNTIFLIYF